MPIYTYACDSCGAEIERRQSFSDQPLTVCESCGRALRRVLHPVGVIFKGTGFYNTDYKNAGANGKAAGDSKASKPAEAGSNGAASGEASKPAEKGSEKAPSAQPSTSGAPSTASSAPASSGSN